MQIKYPLLLDGGLSNELEKFGHDLNHCLWSAHLLESNPKAIEQVHLNYLQAGAQCITTASYQATIAGYKKIGYGQVQAEKLILKSIQLAEKAIEHYKSSNYHEFNPLIAASIGPYGAFLSDGSEYHGNYDVSDEVLKKFHLPRIKILDKSNADILACETIPSFQEAKVLADILQETEKPSWISFSCKDEKHLNDGTPIVDCAAFLSHHPKVFAIGVNCTSPEYISGLIKLIKSKSGAKKIIAYPNSGEIYDAKTKTWSRISDSEVFVELAKKWIELGVDIIGGCCRIGPEQIKSLSLSLK